MKRSSVKGDIEAEDSFDFYAKGSHETTGLNRIVNRRIFIALLRTNPLKILSSKKLEADGIASCFEVFHQPPGALLCQVGRKKNLSILGGVPSRRRFNKRRLRSSIQDAFLLFHAAAGGRRLISRSFVQRILCCGRERGGRERTMCGLLEKLLVENLGGHEWQRNWWGVLIISQNSYYSAVG